MQLVPARVLKKMTFGPVGVAVAATDGCSPDVDVSRVRVAVGVRVGADAAISVGVAPGAVVAGGVAAACGRRRAAAGKAH